jgi:hypothetical protein
MKTILFITFLVCCPVFSLFVITFNAKSLDSYYTLTSNVVYTMNFTMTGASINSGSLVKLIFSNHFNIDTTTLKNCKFALNSISSYSNANCGVAYDTITSKYTITFTNLYSMNGNQTYLSIRV